MPFRCPWRARALPTLLLLATLPAALLAPACGEPAQASTAATAPAAGAGHLTTDSPAAAPAAPGASAPGAMPAAAAGRRPNVLVVCLDTVRADRLGCYGHDRRPTTPQLDELAARGARFADVTAASGWTKPSVPSFLTGTWPLQHGVYEGSAREREGAITDVLPENAVTLAEAFQAAGWVTAAFVQNSQLRAGLGFEQGFDLYRDEVGDATAAASATLQWIDARTGSQPFFIYLHLLDAHWPYDIPEAWAQRFATGDQSFVRGSGSRALRDAVNDGEATLSAEQLATLDALYDGAIAYLDDEVGRVFAGLRQRGLLQDTLVSVVADHGEEFLEHGRLGHGHGLWQNLLSVGWIVAGPGVAPAVHEAPVSLVDLPATLLAAAGLPQPADIGGHARLAAARSAAPAGTPLFAEHKAPGSYEQSLRDGPWKLVRRWLPPDGSRHADTLASMPGTRWEAEVERRGGVLHARQLKPRDEPVDDAPEVKGAVEALSGESFTLAGVRVRCAADVPRAGDDAALAAERAHGLAEGQVVKVRGTFAGTVLVADRLKLYDDADGAPEIRGTVEEVVDDGSARRLRMGSLWITVDAGTEFKAGAAAGAAADDDEPRLPRERLLDAVALGADAAARAGWHVSAQLFDLSRDPGEQQPVAHWSGPLDASAPAELARLSRALDELGRSLSARRTWRTDDRAVLDEEQVEALRAIGYVR